MAYAKLEEQGTPQANQVGFNRIFRRYDLKC
jgi:hypothetical protein